MTRDLITRDGELSTDRLAALAQQEQDEQPMQGPIGVPLLDPATAIRIKNAATELRMAAITMEALASQTEPALLESLIGGADRFLTIGGGRFSDALHDAGHPIPRDE